MHATGGVIYWQATSLPSTSRKVYDLSKLNLGEIMGRLQHDSLPDFLVVTLLIAPFVEVLAKSRLSLFRYRSSTTLIVYVQVKETTFFNLSSRIYLKALTIL
jgi:hypothetical protein